MAEGDRPYDRRRTPRIRVQFSATLTVGKKKFTCQAQEFSEFGILLASTQSDIVGQDVEVALAFNPRERALHVKGVVAYATGTGLAVRFKETTEEQQLSLTNYVLSNSPKS